MKGLTIKGNKYDKKNFLRKKELPVNKRTIETKEKNFYEIKKLAMNKRVVMNMKGTYDEMHLQWIKGASYERTLQLMKGAYDE